MVSSYVALLKDNEAEVRSSAAGQLPGEDIHVLGCTHCPLTLATLGFCALIDREVILARVLPCVKDLSTDSSQHVRAALGMQISGLAPLLGREPTVEHLLPLFLHLLKDEFPDVRLNIISKLETVNSGE